MLFRNVHTAASNFTQTPINILVNQLCEGSVMLTCELEGEGFEDNCKEVNSLKTWSVAEARCFWL